jgi:hypothetical protein
MYIIQYKVSKESWRDYAILKTMYAAETELKKVKDRFLNREWRIRIYQKIKKDK